MFGYITVNEDELKIKDFKRYRSYYCGLCKTLKDRYGIKGQATLSFDMTFLVILLTGLYEPATLSIDGSCALHPFKKHEVRKNDFSEYVADMNIILSYYKCKDDWDDEKKIMRYAASGILSGSMKKIRAKYPQKADFIYTKLQEIRACEKRKDPAVDSAAGLFGEIMAEIFLWKKDEWKNELYQMGFFLGKFIYLLDAYDDMEADAKHGSYNVFLLQNKSEDEIRIYAKDVLTMMAGQCARAFERLPVIEEQDILRNILYSGIWTKYYGKDNKKDGHKSI